MKTTRQLLSFLLCTLVLSGISQKADAQQRRRMMRSFKTDSAMVHDPEMDYENGT